MDSPIKSAFELNVQLLALQNPSLASNIQQTPAQDTFSDENKREFQQWFDRLSLQGIDVLFIFGIGSGLAYEVAQTWLKADKNRCLVFLENQIHVLAHFLHSKTATTLLNDLQVDIYDVSNFESEKNLIRELTQNYLLKTYQVAAIPSYQNKFDNFFSLLTRTISLEMTEQEYLLEYTYFGVHFFQNFYPNLLKLPSAHPGYALFNQFEGIPAIICGAGASLTTSIPELKELKDKAIIFGPGSAMNILNTHGVYPHFGVNVDPNPETLHRLFMNRAFETPTFYQNRLYYEALDAIHGPHLFLSSTSFGLTTRWFEEQLGIPPASIQEGFSVVHAALEIAYHLGCDPIIFVGADFSYKPKQHYGSGIEIHPLYPDKKLEEKSELGSPISLEDGEGKRVFSYWPWIIEANWIDAFSRQHPERTFINATAGGIGLFSVARQSLEVVSQKHLVKTYDLTSIIHEKIQQSHYMPLDQAKIREVIRTFAQELKKCQQLLDNQVLYQIPTPHLMDNLKQQMGYQYFLKPFEEFYLLYTQRERKSIPRLSVEQQEKRTHTLQQELYTFLWQTLQLHLKVIENSLKEPSIDFSFFQSNENETPPSQTDGIHQHYFPNGKLKTEIEYVDGLPHGIVKLYYSNGQLKRELHFEHGRRHGTDRSWYENGQLFIDTEYDNNRAIRSRGWLSDGTLVKEVVL